MWDLLKEYAKPVGIVIAGVLGAQLLNSVVSSAKGYLPAVNFQTQAPAPKADPAPEAPKTSEATTA